MFKTNGRQGATKNWAGPVKFELGQVKITIDHYQVEDDTEILIRYNVWGRGPKFWTRTLVWAAYDDCRQRATSDSRIFIGLSGSLDWSHGESHGPDGPMPAAILENFHCEQPCYGFLGLLKFLCFQTLPNLVNCFLIIFSLVWHPKDFAQIKITHGKNASNPSNRSTIVKSFSLCLTSHH